MQTSRRKFLQKMGLTGLAAMNLSEMHHANHLKGQPKDFNKKDQLTILFQGDSITDGNRTRDNDWNHIMGHGYAYLIASRLWYDYPEENLMFYNKGISGNRVKDLETRWQKDTLDLKPDLLSILIGVNDIYAFVKNDVVEPFEKIKDAYSRILDKTKDDLPDIQLVVCEPFILPLGRVMEKTKLWQTEIEKHQQLVRELSETYDAIFVPLQGHFNEACKKAPANYWIWDGIHPMPAGHELIARTWIEVVSKKLKFIKN